MRFSLQDVKKQIHRRNGELAVSLHFLRAGESHTEIERLVAYHERLLHQPQRLFSSDDARACIGDYRLAHCLICTLSAWYAWQSPMWEEVIARLTPVPPPGSPPAPERPPAPLPPPGRPPGSPLLYTEALPFSSPVQLRLALYDYVNEQHSGFLDAQIRVQALQTFAALYGLTVYDLEYLLALDSDNEALLVRTTPQPPSAADVATLYNQWAFESALFNASDVRFVIDCNAFATVQGSERQGIIGTGVGAVIKRLCYLARKLGVYYDLAYDPASSADASLLQLTLYGPQEMTGVPQQYGMRLARLCRLLLGYGTPSVGAQSITPRAVPASPPRSRPVQRHTLPARAIREAEATVHFLQRAYRFVMQNDLLDLLPSLPTEETFSPQSRPVVESGSEQAFAEAPFSQKSGRSVFDSSIEQAFAEAFSALEQSHAVDGWRLEREPEPFLLEKSIFIPDFALTRGQRRIYVEILGFWTPAYRERKVAKLQQLAGRQDLLLAIPVESREAFASITADFPIAWYEGQLSATDMLQMLRTHFDDFEERLALIDVEAVRRYVLNEGLLLERACYELLHCYRRSELQRTVERVVGDGIAFTPGIGLYQAEWLEHLRRSFVEWFGEVGSLPLVDVLRECRLRWSVLADCESGTIEALLTLWPEVEIRRDSIFEAVVNLVGVPAGLSARASSTEDAASEEASTVPMAEKTPKKHLRERRPAYKKRTSHETAQGDLWGS